MKYMVIVDVVSILDKDSNPHIELGLGGDAVTNVTAVPIFKPIMVSDNGRFVYMDQDHIDVLIDYERREALKSLIICKNCWRKMLDAVGGDNLYRDIDNRSRRNGDSVDTLIKEILPIEENNGRSCKSCKFKDKYISEDPCLGCSALDKWEADDVRSEGTL